ncbi:hypothetical protein SASPL_154315 [Salvia splendens]|uniref:Uncharacterized protein n=1 Tax=Salvia splendens TaxID=180675 RepID=A0A8X8VZX3_SALSN|nr:hypothetical protein SASPL_154315 [Salvia splendens]
MNVSIGVRRNTGKKIESVKTKLAKIFQEKENYTFVPNSQPATNPFKEKSTSSIELKKVHGLDIQRKKNDIVSKLMVDDDEDGEKWDSLKINLGYERVAKMIYIAQIFLVKKIVA